jgi:DNA-binding beta-propeller fold protein YncE
MRVKVRAFAWALWEAVLAVPVLAQPTAMPHAVPEIQFESVADFFKLPVGMHFGETPGVAVDSKRHIFVFSRTNSASGPAYGPTAAQLLEFAPDGKFMRELGKGLYGWSFAHSVRIDRDDNIWAIDKGSDIVVKINPLDQVVWVFGRRQESTSGAKPWEQGNPPLPAEDGLFREPTDIAWDSKGNFYITDGYINSRVAKYDKNGDWVMQWGSAGKGPGQFDVPHAIVIDRDDNVYVGDRGNRRIQVFDTAGKFLRQWSIDVPPPPGGVAVSGATPPPGSMKNVGAPNSLCIPPRQNAVMFVGELSWPARIFETTLDGKILGVLGRPGRNLKQFSGAHAIACPSATEIYVAETLNWRVQKLLLQPLP